MKQRTVGKAEPGRQVIQANNRHLPAEPLSTVPDERGLGRRVTLRTLAITACLVVAAVSFCTAVFTTIDHQEVGTEVGAYDCGSPIDPPDGRFSSVAPAGDHFSGPTPLGQCEDLLDHARATRTAALVWLSASLALLCLIMWTDREPRTGVDATDEEDDADGQADLRTRANRPESP